MYDGAAKAVGGVAPDRSGGAALGGVKRSVV
jgi:hypothetical protein